MIIEVRPINRFRYFTRSNVTVERGISGCDNRTESLEENGLRRLFDNYPVGTLLAVAWEGGGTTGVLASISEGIVTLKGPGNIILGGFHVTVSAHNYTKMLLHKILAVARITSIPTL